MRSNFRRAELYVGRLITALILTVGSGVAAAQNCMSVDPSNLLLNFGQVAVGTHTVIYDVKITNNCSANMQITSFSFSPSEFVLSGGWAPYTIAQGDNMTFEVRFKPDAAQVFNGTFTVNVAGYNPVVVSLTGTGFLSNAVPTWSASSVTFNNVPLGTTSAPQTVTLTNTGTQAVSVESIFADPPFAVSGFTPYQLLQPNVPLPLQVTYTPSFTGTSTGTLVVTTNNLPPTGVSLTGTGVGSKTFGIKSFPTLPWGTQGASYLATLKTTSGVGTVTWSLASGSTLPSGLTLSSTGTITGTIASSVGGGNHNFTVNATDSASHTASLLMTLPVGTPTGAVCNNIDWDVRGTTTPMVPITDLGKGTYLGSTGGLYLNGSNFMPKGHDNDGVNYAKQIEPLDANGNPDPNGKMALISIGMSVASDTFEIFTEDAGADPSVNPQLVFVPGAQPRLGANNWTLLTLPAWQDIFEYFLPQSGVTADQVVAAWVESVDANPRGGFPADMVTLQTELETTAQLLHTAFPNLKIAFFTSREYAAYENGLPHQGDPEPYAYESAFAVRGAIQDQLNGVPGMNYNPVKGPVNAPWIAWGPYIWANGMMARSDGLTWSCHQFRADGEHPSQIGGGSEQDANMLLNFFKNNDATAPWFLAH